MKRIRLSRKKGFRLPETAVNVARPTKWGNPIKVGQWAGFVQMSHGRERLSIKTERPRRPGFGCEWFFVADNEAAVKLFRRYLASLGPEADRLARALSGRDLACFCKLDAPCHADVWLEMAKNLTKPTTI